MSSTLGSMDASQQHGQCTVPLNGLTGDVSLNTDQMMKRTLVMGATASGAISAIFTVAAADRGMWWIVFNNSGQAVTCKLAGQSGIAIANGKTAIIDYRGGADITRVTADNP